MFEFIIGLTLDPSMRVDDQERVWTRKLLEFPHKLLNTRHVKLHIAVRTQRSNAIRVRKIPFLMKKRLCLNSYN
jgi:hypothetical protein